MFDLSVTPHMMRKIVLDAISVKNPETTKRTPVMIWGPPGVGKSDIIRSIGESVGARVVAVHLGQMEPTDLIGIPVVAGDRVKMVPMMNFPKSQVVRSKGRSEVSVNVDWDHDSVVTVIGKDGSVVARYGDPFAENFGDLQVVVEDDFLVVKNVPEEAHEVHVGEKSLLFLDELSTADGAVQNAALQLVLDGKVGEYCLPIHCPCVAAGNREQDGALVNPMSLPLANRFMHLTIRADADEWVSYAIENNLNPTVVGFIKTFPGEIHRMDPDQLGEGKYGYPTPRAYKFLSDELRPLDYYKNLYDGDWDKARHHLMALVSGIIGEETASKFYGYFKMMDGLPTGADLANNTQVAQEFTGDDVDRGAYFGIAISALQYLNKEFKARGLCDEFNKMVENVGRFLYKHSDEELFIWFTRRLTQDYLRTMKPILQNKWYRGKIEKFKDFGAKYAEVRFD